MSRLYDVHLKIPTELLTPLLELIEERDGIVVSMDTPGGSSKLHRLHRRRGSSRSKSGVTSTIAAVLALDDALGNPAGGGGRGAIHRLKVANAIRKYGLAFGSAGAGLSRARDKGWVEPVLPQGEWALTAKGLAALPGMRKQAAEVKLTVVV